MQIYISILRSINVSGKNLIKMNLLKDLYESLGFNEATIRRNYYPTAEGREDAIIMALPISM